MSQITSSIDHPLTNIFINSNFLNRSLNYPMNNLISKISTNIHDQFIKNMRRQLRDFSKYKIQGEEILSRFEIEMRTGQLSSQSNQNNSNSNDNDNEMNENEMDDLTWIKKMSNCPFLFRNGKFESKFTQSNPYEKSLKLAKAMKEDQDQYQHESLKDDKFKVSQQEIHNMTVDFKFEKRQRYEIEQSDELQEYLKQQNDEEQIDRSLKLGQLRKNQSQFLKNPYLTEKKKFDKIDMVTTKQLDYRFGISYENQVPIANFNDFDLEKDHHNQKEFHELFESARIKDRKSIKIPFLYFIPKIQSNSKNYYNQSKIKEVNDQITFLTNCGVEKLFLRIDITKITNLRTEKDNKIQFEKQPQQFYEFEVELEGFNDVCDHLFFEDKEIQQIICEAIRCVIIFNDEIQIISQDE